MIDDGRNTRLSLGTAAIAAAIAFLVSGCSEVGFPSVHDMPAPRAETTMTPDQVKQATDDLASERDRLNTGSLPNGPAAAPNNTAPPKNATSSAQPAAAPGATVTAGAYAKP